MKQYAWVREDGSRVPIEIDESMPKEWIAAIAPDGAFTALNVETGFVLRFDAHGNQLSDDEEKSGPLYELSRLLASRETT